VVLAGELLKESKTFVEEGVHPTVIIRAFRAACELAKAKIRELAVTIDAGKDAATYAQSHRSCCFIFPPSRSRD
jgi:T-complex protein 1 subunit eta